MFLQLIYSGVVDPDNDQLLFTMVIDMLAVLIHHIVTIDPNTLDNNKIYQSIAKRITKETKDFSDAPNSKAINHVKNYYYKFSLLEFLLERGKNKIISKT